MKEKRQYITDEGEIISESMSSFTDTLNEDGYRFPSHKLGARIFADVDYPVEMTLAEIGAMTVIAKRGMIAKTNMLGYRQGRKIKAYTSDEIIEIAGYTARYGRRFISKMLRLHVLHRIQDTSGNWQYYVNPAYYMANGQRLSLSLFSFFKDDLMPLLPAWVINEFLMQVRDKVVFKADAVEEASMLVDKGVK